jgi:hypothetical protein
MVNWLHGMDDDGHSLRLQVPNVLYVPGLANILFSVYKFTKKYNTITHIQWHFITLIYNQDHCITVTLYKCEPSTCQVKRGTEVATKPYTSKNKTKITNELLHKIVGHITINTIITASKITFGGTHMPFEESTILWNQKITVSRAHARNKHPSHNPGKHGTPIYMDIILKIYTRGLTTDKMFLLLIDIHSRRLCLRSIPDKSTDAVIY